MSVVYCGLFCPERNALESRLVTGIILKKNNEKQLCCSVVYQGNGLIIRS